MLVMICVITIPTKRKNEWHSDPSEVVTFPVYFLLSYEFPHGIKPLIHTALFFFTHPPSALPFQPFFYFSSPIMDKCKAVVVPPDFSTISVADLINSSSITSS